MSQSDASSATPLSAKERPQRGPRAYHSPWPDPDEVARFVTLTPEDDFLPATLPDVDLRPTHQRRVLAALARFYSEAPFADEPRPGLRFHYRNGWFPVSDALYLFGFLRRLQPRRVVEVGSGFSSALMLDTAEHFLPRQPSFTFIEPYPQRLYRLLRPEDRARVRVLAQRLQEVPLSVFTELEAGDLLFIDSSHVVRAGNDGYYLFFQVLPALRPGVFVHFHDIFYPFEYPRDWVEQGRAWNEAYVLRAFLAYNRAWRIEFFGSYAYHMFRDFLQRHMPRCLENMGGSIYVQRVH